MRFVTTTFQTVRKSVTKRGTCPICGKNVQRSTTIENTINPFNKNAEGKVKTFNEVLDDVREEARSWEPDFRHQKCIAQTEG